MSPQDILSPSAGPKPFHDEPDIIPGLPLTILVTFGSKSIKKAATSTGPDMREHPTSRVLRFVFGIGIDIQVS